MPQISPVSWPFAVLAFVALPGFAQVNTAPAEPISNSKTAVVAQAAPTALPYRSVFDGYQPFTDEKMRSWKDSNNTVEKIGGWRASAKEAAEPASADKQVPAVTPPKPATPASPAAAANPHAGHGKH